MSRTHRVPKNVNRIHSRSTQLGSLAAKILQACQETGRPIINKEPTLSLVVNNNKKEPAKKRPPLFSNKEVSIPAGQEHVLIFMCSLKLVKDLGDIQIGTSTGGDKALPADVATAQSGPKRTTIVAGTRIDMVSFDKTCTISQISVRAIPKSMLCRVIVNLKSSHDDHGEHWGQGTQYQKLLDMVLFGKKWDRVRIVEGGDKTSIILDKSDPNLRATASTLLSFK